MSNVSFSHDLPVLDWPLDWFANPEKAMSERAAVSWEVRRAE